MSEGVWVALILIVCWGCLPLSLIIANAVFDKDVLRPGEDPHHH